MPTAPATLVSDVKGRGKHSSLGSLTAGLPRLCCAPPPSLVPGEWLGSKEHGRGLRLQMGLLWGNKTVAGLWREGRLSERGDQHAAADLFDATERALWASKRSQGGARETAELALEAAVNARAAAREAMTLARAAQVGEFTLALTAGHLSEQERLTLALPLAISQSKSA